MTTDVLIVGAGPVGLTLAVDSGAAEFAARSSKKGGTGIPPENGAL